MAARVNTLDRLIGWFSPQAALRRRAARSALAWYEAAEPSRLRKFHRDRGSPNEVVQRGAAAIRTQARHLTRNHDLARGALGVLVNCTVGPKGIGIEPQPRRQDGSIHEEYAQQLLEAYRDWCRHPDVTGRMPWPRLQRALARAWFRDGEAFGQMITGVRADLDHGTRVPFSLECFESDLVPFDLNDSRRNIVQGFERNQWGKPLAVHVLKTDAASIGMPLGTDTKRIPWERVLHIATLDHIGQIRGVSAFASVITRLEDIKDYEESERVAAKIAAMLTGFIRKGSPDLYNPEGAPKEQRTLGLSPGVIFDDLQPGEEVGLIDSKRPNPNVAIFRQGQLRAVAAGIGASYSSLARDYNGTYSAQRQELVEQWIHYATLTDEFVGEIIQPVWEAFVEACHLSGVVRKPRDLKPGTENDAAYIAQAMPWIDPLKEANAWVTMIEANLASEAEAIRRRGGNPHDVIEQRAEFKRAASDAGLTALPSTSADPEPEEDEDETDAELRAHQQRMREAREEATRVVAEAEKAAALARQREAENRAAQAENEAARAAAEAAALAAECERIEAARLREEQAETEERAARIDAAKAAEDLAAAQRAVIEAQAERERVATEAERLRVQREQVELQAAQEGLEELRK